MTVGAALREALVRLSNASPTPQLDAALLTAHALGLERTKLLTSRNEPIEDEAALRLDALIVQREHGVPVAYLLGSAGFYGREFEVTPAVLVPRPETEHLVETAIDFLNTREPSKQRIWDVGTGSGAIAIALALEVPTAVVVASDISDEALRVARRNAGRHGVTERIRFIESDLTETTRTAVEFDLVIANLPYIPTSDVPQPPAPAGYEPAIALNGGVDGLAVYRRLIAHLPNVVASHALVLAEAAPPTMAALKILFQQAMPSATITTHRDHANQDRYLKIQLP